MKKRILRNWIVKVLGFILGSWFFFIGTTIDSLGNKTYDTILVVWTTFALVSFYLLKKYSNIFE